jgi:hypothetical protein
MVGDGGRWWVMDRRDGRWWAEQSVLVYMVWYLTAWVRGCLWMTVANVAGYVLSYGFIRCQCVGASGISYFLNYLNVSS